MMILDLQQVMLSNMFMQTKNNEINESMIRHMVLNSIRAYNKKFKQKYGELIIACDDYKYWRKDVFGYYKANRKKNRDESPLDWDLIFKSLNLIKEELKETFPYRVIQVSGAEADDVIAVLCETYGYTLGQPILIISADKDFVQLHKYPMVEQFNPIMKKFVVNKDPEGYLKEHIITGDTGDGVPNVLSSDDCLVLGIKQTTMSAKRKEKILAGDYEGLPIPKEQVERNVARNKQLIDMSMIPSELQSSILVSYNEQSNKKHKDLFNYFVKHRLKNLTEGLGDFYL